MKTLCFHTNSMFVFRTHPSVMMILANSCYFFANYWVSFIRTIFLFNELFTLLEAFFFSLFRLLFHFGLRLLFTHFYHSLTACGGRRSHHEIFIDSIKFVNKIDSLPFTPPEFIKIILDNSFSIVFLCHQLAIPPPQSITEQNIDVLSQAICE